MRTKIREGQSKPWWAVGTWRKTPGKAVVDFKPLAILRSRKQARDLCEPGEVVRRLEPRYLD